MFSFKKLFDALKKLCKEENINEKKMRDIIEDSLRQAYVETVFKDRLFDNNLKVKALLNQKGTEVEFFLTKKIKEKVNDDSTEISLNEAKKISNDKQLKYDCEIDVKCGDFDNKNKLEIFLNNFKKIFQKKIDCEEKTVLYNAYKDHINEIVMAKVEKIDNRGTTVKIGNVSALLTRKAKIGDEFFFVDQQIAVFLEDTSDENRKSISITRSNKGFLREILKREIFEIYQGIIVIENIARIAGKRSKVAVYSINSDVSATGSCIGKNSSRLAKVVEQLGGNGYDKERVDIIQYSKDDLLYIMNAIRPAEAVGAKIINKDDNIDAKIIGKSDKRAICVVKDGQFLKAVGLNGINVRLAAELTGYELTVIEESEAKNKNIDYITKEELEQEEIIKKEEKKKKDFLEQALAYKKKNDAKEKENDDNDNNSSISNYDLKKNDFTNIEITESLSDMEASVVKTKKKEVENNKDSKEFKNDSNFESNADDKNIDSNEKMKKMDIYTKEELNQIEKENEKEDSNNYNLKDFDEDFDDYYDNKE